MKVEKQPSCNDLIRIHATINLKTKWCQCRDSVVLPALPKLNVHFLNIVFWHNVKKLCTWKWTFNLGGAGRTTESLHWHHLVLKLIVACILMRSLDYRCFAAFIYIFLNNLMQDIVLEYNLHVHDDHYDLSSDRISISFVLWGIKNDWYWRPGPLRYVLDLCNDILWD